MKRDIFLNARVLFIIDGCSHCQIYKEFIERFNLNLPVNSQIKVIDCTQYDNHDIITHPLIRLFNKHIEAFPTLFIDGAKVEGANSREELEYWLKGRLHKDFIIPVNNPYIFNKHCYFREGKVECA